MRLCTVTSPILSDAMPTGSHLRLQAPVRHPTNPQGFFRSSRYAPCASLRIDPQLPVAVGLTGLDNTSQRMLVIDVEPNKLVHREPPVKEGHGAFKRPQILPAAGGSGFIVSRASMVRRPDGNHRPSGSI